MVNREEAIRQVAVTTHLDHKRAESMLARYDWDWELFWKCHSIWTKTGLWLPKVAA